MWLVLAGGVSPSSWHTPPCPPSPLSPPGGTPVIEDATRLRAGPTHTLPTRAHTDSAVPLCAWRNTNKDKKIVLLAEWEKTSTSPNPASLCNELEINSSWGNLLVIWIGGHTFGCRKFRGQESLENHSFIHLFTHSFIHLKSPRYCGVLRFSSFHPSTFPLSLTI